MSAPASPLDRFRARQEDAWRQCADCIARVVAPALRCPDCGQRRRARLDRQLARERQARAKRRAQREARAARLRRHWQRRAEEFWPSSPTSTGEQMYG